MTHKVAEGVEDYDALFKELRGLAEKSFGVDDFTMVSKEEEAELECGDDLEVEMEELEASELHIVVNVSVPTV